MLILILIGRNHSGSFHPVKKFSAVKFMIPPTQQPLPLFGKPCSRRLK